MAKYKIYPSTAQEPSPQSQLPGAESTLSRVGRGSAYALGEGAALPGYLLASGFNQLNRLVPEWLMPSTQGAPPSPFLTEQERQERGIVPQSIPEKYLYQGLRSAPLAGATGGLMGLLGTGLGTGAAGGLEAAGAPEYVQQAAQRGLQAYTMGGLPSLVGTLSGQAAGKGLSALGAPQAVQTGGDILTDILAGTATGAIKKGLTPSAVRKKSYEELGPITQEAGQVSLNPLQKSLNELRVTAQKTGVSETRGVLDDIENTILEVTKQGNKADLRDLWHAKKQLDTLYNKAKKQNVASEFSAVRKSLDDILKGEESKLVNPKFYENLTTADQLSVAEHTQTRLSEAAEKLKPSIVDVVLSKKLALAKAALSGIFKTVDASYQVMKSPAMRKIAFQIAESEAPQAFVRNVNKAVQLQKQERAKPVKGKKWTIY